MDLVTDGRYNYIGFGGGVRGTKTWGVLSTFIVLARIFPGSRWCVMRKTLELARQTTIPSFNKLRPRTGGFVLPINLQTFEAPCANGSVIMFRGENIDKDPELERMDGYEVNGFGLEEGDEMQERTFHKAIERAGAWIVPDGEQPDPLVLVTFNPNAAWPKTTFYDPWEQGTLEPPYAFLPATIDDNPYAGAAYRASLKNLPPEDYAIRVKGDWSKLAGEYYRSLNREIHLVERSRLPRDLPPWWEYWGSFDWGYAHWAVFLAWCRDGDGNIFLLDSCWVRRAQDDEIARTIIATMPEQCLHEVYAGHDCWGKFEARGASGTTTAEVFDAHGIYLAKADIDLVNGGRAVRRALAVEALPDGGYRTGVYIVDSESEHIVDERRVRNNRRVFEQLSTIRPDEKNINKPAKVDADAQGRGGDDGADAFRYGLATRMQVPEEPWPTAEVRAIRAKLDSASRAEAEEWDEREGRLKGESNRIITVRGSLR